VVADDPHDAALMPPARALVVAPARQRVGVCQTLFLMGHPHPPGNRARPKPHARLPAAMRPRSQTTLAIPWFNRRPEAVLFKEPDNDINSKLNFMTCKPSIEIIGPIGMHR
jgi:hypothetical protein